MSQSREICTQVFKEPKPILSALQKRSYLLLILAHIDRKVKSKSREELKTNRKENKAYIIGILGLTL